MGMMDEDGDDPVCLRSAGQWVYVRTRRMRGSTLKRIIFESGASALVDAQSMPSRVLVIGDETLSEVRQRAASMLAQGARR